MPIWRVSLTARSAATMRPLIRHSIDSRLHEEVGLDRFWRDHKYLVFRRTKGAKEPLPQTLNRENIVLRGMLKFAEVQGWLAPAPAVPFIPDRLAKRRRCHFTDEEYGLLRRTALRRIREIKRHGDKRERISVLPLRQLLYDVIQLLANSGLRVDELKKSGTWRNVLWDEGDLLLEAAERPAVPVGLFFVCPPFERYGGLHNVD